MLGCFFCKQDISVDPLSISNPILITTTEFYHTLERFCSLLWDDPTDACDAASLLCMEEIYSSFDTPIVPSVQ